MTTNPTYVRVSLAPDTTPHVRRFDYPDRAPIVTLELGGVEISCYGDTPADLAAILEAAAAEVRRSLADAPSWGEQVPA